MTGYGSPQPECVHTTSYCLPRLPSFPKPFRSLKLLKSEDLAGLRAEMCLTKELVALGWVVIGADGLVASALPSLSGCAGDGAAACIPDGERHPEEAASLSLARCLRLSEPFYKAEMSQQECPHTSGSMNVCKEHVQQPQ